MTYKIILFLFILAVTYKKDTFIAYYFFNIISSDGHV